MTDHVTPFKRILQDMNDSDQGIFKVNLLKFSFEPSVIQLPRKVLRDPLETETCLIM